MGSELDLARKHPAPDIDDQHYNQELMDTGQALRATTRFFTIDIATKAFKCWVIVRRFLGNGRNSNVINMTRIRKVWPEALRELTDPVMCTRRCSFTLSLLPYKCLGTAPEAQCPRPSDCFSLCQQAHHHGRKKKLWHFSAGVSSRKSRGDQRAFRVGRECEGQLVPHPMMHECTYGEDRGFTSYIKLPKLEGRPPKVFGQEMIKPEMTLQIALGNPLAFH